MKRKINSRIIFIAIIITIITTVSITFIYYGIFQERVKKDLKIEAELLCEAGITQLINKETILNNKDIRITWIDKDGVVVFDNDFNAESLANHMDRPEVKSAFKTGVGESVRKSDTMNMRTFYYAIRMSDGTVLRVSTEASSIFSVFLSTFPIVLIIIVLIIIACAIISNLLTKQLLQPINEMAENMDNSSFESGYKELDPFMLKIKEQHENILAAAKSRQDFTANVSHELKTPLAAISGYAELIENRMVDEEKIIHFASEIRRNTDRLVLLINDTIRLSELDYAESETDFVQLDLYSIVKERLEFLKNNTREKNITLSLEGEKALVLANKGMMIELIDNLVQNAIRYNVQNGSINVTVNKEGNHVILKVSDTGIGIPVMDQEHVFERFYRVDKSRSRDTGGTGLGLAIVKHIVEIHSGEIELKSKEKEGTTISIKF